MASTQVTRVTMFKIPKKEDRDAMIENYKAMTPKALKVSCMSFGPKLRVLRQVQDGKPYIVSLEAGPTEEDARNQGYTFVAKSVFKNMEDFEFYDKHCEAHHELKAKAKNLDVQGMMMIFFSPAVTSKI